MRDERPLLVSTGEPSGDAHAAAVVAHVLGRHPGLAVEAIGGPKLAATGARLRASIDDLSVIGFVEVVRRLPAHVKLLRGLARDLAAGRYRAALLVDYPGFHLRVAESARRAGVPVLYYVAPQLWGWGEWRVPRFARAVDQLAVILPFEEEYFRGHGIAAHYVGHPLLDRDALPAREQARAALGVPPHATVLGLFPGSRVQEVARHWPVFRDAAQLVRNARPEVTIVAAGTAGARYPHPGSVLVAGGDSTRVFAAADVALAKSGTTTLEAALADVPMVIAYRVHPASYLIARRLARVPWIGLVNLVAERQVAPELLQHDAEPGRLAAALLELLDPTSGAAAQQRVGLEDVRRRLGSAGAAERVADLLEEQLA